MHTISFLAKRLHLVTNAYGQRVLDAVARVEGMTPARFDLLCLMRQPALDLQRRSRRAYKAARARTGKDRDTSWPGRDGASMTQKGIVRRLGLHPSTVSKMIKRLVEMGWLCVSRSYDDGRMNVIDVTPLGLRRIWEAMRRVFRGREVRACFESVHRGLRPSVHVVHAIDETRSLLWHLADAFGDTSELEYAFGAPSPPRVCAAAAA